MNKVRIDKIFYKIWNQKDIKQLKYNVLKSPCILVEKEGDFRKQNIWLLIIVESEALSKICGLQITFQILIFLKYGNNDISFFLRWWQ